MKGKGRRLAEQEGEDTDGDKAAVESHIYELFMRILTGQIYFNTRLDGRGRSGDSGGEEL